MIGSPPFPAATFVGISLGRIVVADAEAVDGPGDAPHLLQFELLGPTGSTEAIVRAPVARIEVTEADREEYVEALQAVARTPQETQMATMLARSLLFPDRHPAYHALLTDVLGHIWLRTGRDFSPMRSSKAWRVFSPEGRYLGDLEMPERLRPLAITADEIVGVWRDEFDVESVRAYRLRR